MNRSRTYRWARRAVWGTLAVVMTIGCSPLTTIAFLTHRDTKLPAECPLAFKEGPKKGKEEVVVAVLVTPGSGQGFEFAGADRVIASEIAKRLPEMARENKQKLVVIKPADVDRYKMANSNWKLAHPTKLGKDLGADFVLDIHLDSMSLYQPGSLNQIYEGRAEVTVDTYDVDDAGGAPKYKYTHAFSYPNGIVRSAESMPARTFKQLYYENLATELCRHHVDYKPGSGIAEGR